MYHLFSNLLQINTFVKYNKIKLQKKKSEFKSPVGFAGVILLDLKPIESHKNCYKCYVHWVSDPVQPSHPL